MVSFDRGDYVDDESFLDAMRSIEDLPYRAFAKRCPAQHHLLMEEKWRRMMDATTMLREPVSVKVVEERATRKTRRESLWLEFTFNFGIRRRVFEIGGSSKGAVGARARAKDALRRHWLDVNSQSLRATCEAFGAELELAPSKFRSELASVMRSHLDGTTANVRQAATWRAGVNMDAVDAALHAFYDSLDGEALTFTSSVMDSPTWSAYVAFRDHKAACAEAVKIHAGLAAFHFPPSVIGPVSAEPGSIRDSEDGAWVQFCSDTVRLLSPTALALLSAASQRYVLTALSRVFVKVFDGRRLHEEEVWEVASIVASFMNECADRGGLPTYSVIRLAPLYGELFDWAADGVRRAVAMARCIDASDLRAKDACFLYFRMLEERPGFVDDAEAPNGGGSPPTVDSIVRAYAETLRLTRMGHGPLSGGLSESIAERFSGRVAGRVTAATSTLKSMLRPIDAQVLAVPGYSPEGGAWAVSEVKLVGAHGRLQVTFSLTPPGPKGSANLNIEFGAGAADGVDTVSGVFSYVAGFAVSRHVGGKPPGRLEAQVNKVAKPRSRVALLPAAVLARLERLIAGQLRDIRQSHPWLFHCIFPTSHEVHSLVLDRSKRPTARTLETLLKVALSSREVFGDVERSIVGLLVGMHPRPFGRIAQGLTLVEAAMDCSSPAAVAHLMACLRAHSEWDQSSPSPEQASLVESTVGAAMTRQSAEFLFALLGPRPELTPEQVDAYREWHPMLQTSEITAAMTDALMTRGIRVASKASANDSAFSEPPTRRRRMGV